MLTVLMISVVHEIRRIPAHLEGRSKKEENIFMQYFPFAEEEFLERSLKGAWGLGKTY